MRCFQLNLNRARLAHDLLEETVVECNTEIAFLSEYNRPYHQRGGWLADLTDSAALWTPTGYLLEDTRAGEGFVRARVQGIYWYSCYFSPNISLQDFARVLDELVADVRQHQPCCLAGDFNAWAEFWGSRYTNGRGRILLEAFAHLDLVLLNEGAVPTFIREHQRAAGADSHQAASSIIDLSFVTVGLASRVMGWEVLETVYTASDHRALRWELITTHYLHQPAVGVSARRGWCSSVFDCKFFQALIGEWWRPAGDLADQDIIQGASLLTDAISRACDGVMPRRRLGHPQPRSVYWWCEDLAVLRRVCLRARRRYQRARRDSSPDTVLLRRDELRMAKRQLNKAIRERKKTCWREFLATIDDDPWGKPYHCVVKKLSRSRPVPAMVPERAVHIVSSLFPEVPAVDLTIPEDHLDNDGFFPVSLEEVQHVAARVRASKAPGPDGIPGSAVKAAVNIIPEAFVNVFSASLRSGVFPHRWKRQWLVLVPKPGKASYDHPSSFRPICLLDVVGKMLERVVFDRILTAVEAGGDLSPLQYGFRRGRSTLDAIRVVVERARTAISGPWRLRKYCLVVALDVRNAFNSASWEAIWSALVGFHVPMYLLRWIKSYFTDRRLLFDTTEGVRESPVTCGVPQGSILGPLLWNIMYDGVLRLPLPAGAELIGFADDLALTVVGPSVEMVSQQFSAAYDRVERWMRAKGLTLAPEKSEAVLISSRKRHENLVLHLGNQEIETKPYIRYLGVILDRRLTFGPHIDHACVKVHRTTALLSRLMPNLGGPRQLRRRLYASVASSIMMYGAPIWAEALRRKVRAGRFTAVQRGVALRVACAYRTVSADAANVVAGLVPAELLADERQRLSRRGRLFGSARQNAMAEERAVTLDRWQVIWEASTKGRWTFRLIPNLVEWMTRADGETNFFLTQLLTGHGCFRAYLFRFCRDWSPLCPDCLVDEDAQHVFFVCPRFAYERLEWRTAIGLDEANLTPEALGVRLMSDPQAWVATSTYAAAVLAILQATDVQRRRALAAY